MIDFTKPFWVIFSVLILVCLPVLLYYARKNPNPRFRPRPGELAFVALLMGLGSYALAFLMSFMFHADDIKKESERFILPGHRKSSPAPAPGNNDQG